jgi:ATP-binding cassette subfamily B protein
VSPVRRLLDYVLRYRLRYAAGIACLFLASLFSLGIPWTVKEAVDAIAREGSAASLGRPVAIILLLAAAHGLARLGSRFTILGAGQRVEHDVRRDLYAHLQTLPPAFYHRHRTGDLMSRASSDAAVIRIVAGFGGAMLAGTTFTFAGTLVAMWLIHPGLTLLALAPFPPLVLIARRFNHDIGVRAVAVQEELGALSAKVQENLSGMTVVRAHVMEERETAEFGRLNGEYLRASIGLARAQAIAWPLLGLISGLGALIILWFGGRAVVDGRMSLGAFVAFNGYLAQLAWPTMALGWTLASLRRGLASMQRIAEVLDAPAPAGRERGDGAAAAAGPAPSRLPRGSIEFRHLTFAHEGRGPALQDVSFTVPEGALVAVVGPTGSGKSTLGALLCRLFEPPRGTILVAGADARDLPLAGLRRSVGYVPQEAFLFSRSLRENVLLADEAAGEERLRAAVEMAGLGEEARGLPAGWDTVVGERGLALSGGQRQRAALARALLGDPPYLVLDDVLAAVDAAKEREILDALRAAMRGRTTLLMTHRLGAAEGADRIVVLDRGRLVEQGRHETLLAAGGLYARLWRAQRIEDELARA